ncbi:hypothetical protein ECZC04_53900 [Escherichia coli]|nr:hypothetical protein ECZC04_53900 [Escherichia coli]GJI24490.1 hypothetical protein ECZC16_53080 [Escherichia coli]
MLNSLRGDYHKGVLSYFASSCSGAAVPLFYNILNNSPGLGRKPLFISPALIRSRNIVDKFWGHGDHFLTFFIHSDRLMSLPSNNGHAAK